MPYPGGPAGPFTHHLSKQSALLGAWGHLWPTFSKENQSSYLLLPSTEDSECKWSEVLSLELQNVHGLPASCFFTLGYLPGKIWRHRELLKLEESWPREDTCSLAPGKPMFDTAPGKPMFDTGLYESPLSLQLSHLWNGHHNEIYLVGVIMRIKWDNFPKAVIPHTWLHIGTT